MGDRLKGVHLLPQQDYEKALVENQIDDDVIYVTPEDFSSLAREQVRRIDKNEADIAVNKQNIIINSNEILTLKSETSSNASEIVNVKNTITDVILRDTNQDNRLTEIENNYANKSNVVTLSDTQTITGPKTFTEHIYLANSDGTVDRISHLNNNFIIHSGATNSAVLNIDEGLSKIYAFNKELAFKEDIISGGTISGGYLKAITIDANQIVITDQSDNATDFANIRYLGDFSINRLNGEELDAIEALNNCKTLGTYLFTVQEKTEALIPETRTYLMVVKQSPFNVQGILNLDTLTTYTRTYFNDAWTNFTINTISIYDGTLTIQKNGTTVGTFSANSSYNKTINIEVPDIPTNLVTTDTEQTISGAKTFLNTTKFGKWQVVTNSNNELEWSYVG